MILLRQPPLKKLVSFLQSEDLAEKTVLHFTGSMYGIGCKVSSRQALERIKRLKQRPDNSGMIVLIPGLKWFEGEQVHIPDRLIPLLEQYWPGNLTVVFRCPDDRFAHLAVNGKVAFRVPGEDFLRLVLDLMDEPLVSTSVNRSGLPAETDLKRITTLYESWFDYGLLPAKNTPAADPQPSTIVEFVSSPEEGNQSGFDELKCLREGSIPFYGIKQSFARPTIMFVCTANICRSPIAEKLFNHYALQAGLNYAGDSCGLMSGGQSISLGSLQLLLEQGITEAQDHVSKQFTPDLLSASRLVLTMEERQCDILRGQVPDLAAKIFTLNEYLGEPGDITDPFGSNLDYYRHIYTEIDDRIQRLVKKLSAQQTEAQ